MTVFICTGKQELLTKLLHTVFRLFNMQWRLVLLNALYKQYHFNINNRIEASTFSSGMSQTKCFLYLLFFYVLLNNIYATFILSVWGLWLRKRMCPIEVITQMYIKFYLSAYCIIIKQNCWTNWLLPWVLGSTITSNFIRMVQEKRRWFNTNI